MNTPEEIARAVRVAAGRARDAGDLRLLLDRLGIDRPQPRPDDPQLPRLPCTYSAWQDFKTGKNGKRGPRRPPQCRRCGSVFPAWHRCPSP